MNDDLTPNEHSDLRDRLIAGARSIRPAGAHRRAWTAGTLAVVLVTGLSATAIGASSLLSTRDPDPMTSVSPSPTPTSSSTLTPDPSPTPRPDPESSSEPRASVPAFGGSCGNVLTDAEVSSALGGTVTMQEQMLAWSDGADELAGGVRCIWFEPNSSSYPSVWLLAYPADTMAALGTAPQSCADSGDLGYTCTSRTVAHDTWIDARISGPSPEAAAGLLDLVVQRAADYPSPRPAERGDGWWSPSCEQIVAAVADAGPAELAGTTLVPQDSLVPGWWSIDDIAGTRVSCYMDSPAIGLLNLKFVPGGGSGFPEIASTEGAVSVATNSGVSAVRVEDSDPLEGHFPPLVASDGVNLLSVQLDDADGTDPAGTLRAAIADAVIAALG